MKGGRRKKGFSVMSLLGGQKKRRKNGEEKGEERHGLSVN